MALAANAHCLILLSHQKNREVHTKVSWIFTQSDIVTNSDVILAAIVVFLSQSRLPDLIVGAGISLLVIRGEISILIDAKKKQNKPRHYKSISYRGEKSFRIPSNDFRFHRRSPDRALCARTFSRCSERLVDSAIQRQSDESSLFLSQH